MKTRKLLLTIILLSAAYIARLLAIGNDLATLSGVAIVNNSTQTGGGTSIAYVASSTVRTASIQGDWTQDITTSGTTSDAYVIYALAYYDPTSDRLVGVTFAGNAMELLGTFQSSSDTAYNIALFGYAAGSSLGASTYTFSVDVDSTGGFTFDKTASAGSIYSGVNQITPHGTTAVATPDNVTVNVTSATDELVSECL